jgi:prepilin-type N-terminal cleavage/methylation domain-containing protein
MKSGQSSKGFTLVEALTVVVVIGIISLAMVPLLSSQDSTKLDAAAGEVRNALRFAISEAGRTGGYVLVDGSAGHLRAVYSDSSGATSPLGAVKDPLTKRDLDIDTENSAFSGQVSMTINFMGGTTPAPYPRLLIGPGTQLWAFSSAGANQGTLRAGSGVVLTLGAQSVTVSLNEVTGLVTLR